MLTPDELHLLQRELAGTRILSVYLDTGATDPAQRESWRAALHNAVRDARSRLENEDERDDFDRAAAFLNSPEPSPAGTWRSHGWVAFVAPDGPRYMGDLPVTPGTHAVWRTGPVVSPYLRALKQLRPVLVALVQSGSARLFRYAAGKLDYIEELTAPGVDTARPGRPSISSIQGMSAPAPRSSTGSDAVSKRRRDSFERLAITLGERLAQLGNADSWILIGGTREWAMLAGDALGRQFADRMLVSTTLAHDASEHEIADAAKHAASELRATHGLMLVDQLVEQSGARARAVVGIPATQRALRENAVDTLLVTPRFIGTHKREVEDFVRASIAIGADVEVPSGKAAEHLDRIADGIAARLRFPIDELPDLPEVTEAGGPPA